MSRSRPSSPTAQILAQGREMLALSQRAIALGHALQALTGSTPHGAGQDLVSDAQARVAAMLDRAEAATRQIVRPSPATVQVNRRARHHFI